MTLPKTILVAVDFSPLSDRAVEYAFELAKELGARVHLVHGFVMPVLPGPEAGLSLPGDLIDTLERDCQQGLEKNLARYAKSGVKAEAHLEWEDPRHAVVDMAKKYKADLVVIGTHGRKGWKRALMGSVAEAVVRFAPCPVLAVR